MKTRTKTKARQTWVLGSKKRGISVTKLHYPYTYNPWRVAIWKDGKQILTEEYPTRREAITEARERARINWVE